MLVLSSKEGSLEFDIGSSLDKGYWVGLMAMAQSFCFCFFFYLLILKGTHLNEVAIMHLDCVC